MTCVQGRAGRACKTWPPRVSIICIGSQGNKIGNWILALWLARLSHGSGTTVKPSVHPFSKDILYFYEQRTFT